MKKYISIIQLALLSTLYVGCNSYQLASYYTNDDGIYLSSDRGIDYEAVFNNYVDEPLNDYSSNENDLGYLPWGANPESTEIVNNFYPSFGRYYYDPFYFNMGFNPYFGYNGYGFGPTFYYNLFGYETGYPFYGHYSFYYSPYSYRFGNHYWYMMRYRRHMPWYYGGIYNSTVYRDHYDNVGSNRVSFSNSASRRGGNSSSKITSRKSDTQGVRISGIYSRIGSSGGVYIDRTKDVSAYDDFDRSINLREVRNNNLIGVYSRGNSNSKNINRNSSIPNLSKIKSDYVRESYRQVRSVNPSQRGNSYYRSSNYNYTNSNSERNFNNRSYRNSSSRFGSSGSRSSHTIRGGSFSSSSSGVSRGGGSRGSSGGSRGGGNIN